MSAGKSVRLFLADGTPGGLLTAEIMNWTGHVIAAPRQDLAALLKRPESSRTGVYLLLGDDPQGIGGQMAYIGEGDDVGKRLYQHSRAAGQGGKDFWDRAVLLTSKDANLTKAHVRYLESRFITLASQAKRATLANGTAPDPIALPEADRSDMEYYVEQTRIILPVLGVNIFRSLKTRSSEPVERRASQRDVSPTFHMALKKEGIQAVAKMVDGEFTVLENSAARGAWIGTPTHTYRRLRSELEDDGTLAPADVGTAMRFTRDYAFTSSSAAAAVVVGRTANGRTGWLTDTGLTYGDWESQGVEEAIQSGVDDE